jgi:menaquinone-dependent protoporphyrinogen oxidase
MIATDHHTMSASAKSDGPRLVVAYASEFGSTKGIAGRVTATLRQAGDWVELRHCDAVADLAPYAAVVFVYPVFDQRWMPEAEQFVQRNAESLAARPRVALQRRHIRRQQAPHRPLMTGNQRAIGAIKQAIDPREYRVFADVIDRDLLGQPDPFDAAVPELGCELGSRDCAGLLTLAILVVVTAV